MQASSLKGDLDRLLTEPWEKSWQSQSKRRAEIPKLNGSGVRLLGIPWVRDGAVQQDLLDFFQPIFDLELC